jgi:non-ribosomal peptide synthetase component F
MLNSATDLKLKVAELDFDWLPVDSHTSKYDLQLHIDEGNGVLTGNIEFNTSLFTHTTMQRMAANYVELLAQICVEPMRAVCAYPLLTQSERTQLLQTWNATQFEYPRDKLIHQLIETQAASTPANIAVSFASRQTPDEPFATEHWTYAELNTRANQIARALIALNVAPDTLVGVCLERSLHMVAALLGVLKAGCAYVPIDPLYPQERTEYVIENACLKILITEQGLLENLPATVSTLCVDRDAARRVPPPTQSIHPALPANPKALRFHTRLSSTSSTRWIRTSASHRTIYCWQ